MDANQDADSYYVQDCRQVQNNTHTVQTLTGQISRLVGALDAEKDRLHCRQMVDEAVASVVETRAILTRIREHQKQAQNAAERNNRRMMHQKLSDNLGITARVLEDVVRRFLAQVRRHAEASKAAEAPIVDAADAAGGDEHPPEQPLKQDSATAVQCVEEHMEALKRIYTDLANAAEEHEGTFESMSMESHLLSTSMDIERGREEIQIPGYYRTAWLRQRTWTLAGGSVAVLVAVGLFMSS
jgi:hypothetical protein